MPKNLVIVESPAKAKTINKILGADFVVKASMGHVRDLPVKKFGVNLRRGFAADYELVKGREKIIQDLEKTARGCDLVYLAPDPDREGEAIAWHLREVLEKVVPAEKFRRVSYNEITPRAVRAAFEHPTEIDGKRVDAQQARRVLDRIVGYKVSPLLWRRVKRGLSAGRVQSVALRLVCEREMEIRNFVPQEYFLVGAVVRKQAPPQDPFRIRLGRIDGKPADIKSREQADAVLQDLDDRPLRVARIIRREIAKRALPPFITSTLQQSASGYCGYSPDRTMRIAQTLYEGVDLGDGPLGLITYMRTDSFTISQDALVACREMIATRYGAEYLPESPNVYRSRSGAQGAHEAIRPTDVALTPDALQGRISPEQHKLYALIWKRFVASQMVPARIDQRTAEIEAVPPPDKTSTYLFRATASQVAFAGYMVVSGVPTDAVREKKKDGADDAPEEEVERLPALSEGERLDRLEWLSERRETQPPPRFSEASLVRALEENGVGRPSTYAQILSTLDRRKYVKVEKRTLFPSDLGLQVSELLVACLGALFDVSFTAEMEKKLDEIEDGRIDRNRMLTDFYEKFVVWMKQAQGPNADAAKVRRLIEVLGGVKEWAPDVERAGKMVGDRKFVESVSKKAGKSPDGISDRQLQALARIAVKYKDQMPDLAQALTEIGLLEALTSPPPGPSASTVRKLELLRHVTCQEPVERAGRKYDDRAFIDSLQGQAADGRSLSPAQIRALDRLVVKYKEQIPEFDRVSADLELVQAIPADDAESGPLLTQLTQVREWKPPVKRGRRMMDDRAFYESLSRQYAERKFLSPKQIAALKKLVKRYEAPAPAVEPPAAGEA